MPPPPPRNLTAPTGYVAFQNEPTPVGTLKRVGAFAKWTMAATAIAGILGAVSSIVLAPMLDQASGFLAGTVTEEEFNDAYLASQLLSGLQTVAVFATGVFTILWMYRIAANVRVYSRTTTFHPVFSIVGWFLPPFLFVLPLLILRELWKASDPDTDAGDQSWKGRPVNPLLYVWFVVYGIIPGVLSAFVFFSTLQSIFDGSFVDAGSAQVTAETLDSSGGFTVASGVVSAIAAVVWIVFVKQLTARHIDLTGES